MEPPRRGNQWEGKMRARDTPETPVKGARSLRKPRPAGTLRESKMRARDTPETLHRRVCALRTPRFPLAEESGTMSRSRAMVSCPR